MKEMLDDPIFFVGDAFLPFIKNDLKNYQFEDFNFSYEQKGIEYKINSYGYRSDEFIENVDLLALGCSNTLGLGIPNQYTWPELSRSDEIKTVNSLASCGDSAQGQVIKFFQYVKKFGNPKRVVAAFPAFRMEFPLENGTWEVSKKEKNFTLIHDNKASLIIGHPKDEHFEKYAAAPYDPNKIFTKQLARYYTHTFINILDIYCRNFNIPFKYTITDYDYRFYNSKASTKSLLQYMLENDDNFFIWEYPLPSFTISENEINLNCHQEYKGEYFYRANDYVEGKSNGHWGIHQHIHLADAVKKALNGDRSHIKF